MQELSDRLARMSRNRFLFPWEQSTREQLQRERDAAVRDAVAAAIEWKRRRDEQIAAAREEEARVRAEMAQLEAERDRAATEGAFSELHAVLNSGNPQLVAEAEAFMVSLLNQLNLAEQQGHQIDSAIYELLMVCAWCAAHSARRPYLVRVASTERLFTETFVDTSLSYKSISNVSSYELPFAREICGTAATVCVCDQPTVVRLSRYFKT